MQTGANQIDGHEEYIIRGLMKGDPDEKMVPAELRTRSWFWFWARGITEEMGILRGEVDLVFFHGLLVKLQETSFVHVGKKHSFVIVGNVLPVCVVLAVLAESMGVFALPLVAAEIEADASAILEFSLVGEGF